ncbi:type II toxin-antitoxin system RelE/ParE family toxin [Aquimarina sp. U1-2]|uniref:type II toxin-antitoxin system RelE/ParE family toxin n=1 Tax=Aquimarina sp. U1-2 TaxID=2823141 RepID=UPI001AECA745|nr:type II toxin-antitoxin system RelE/ParE family toxin [Aquimarina sp. U1-2]MBP2832620.1 type II toxin-antitoxin system RelE/ParE family toxin [Aquimarina sp. U1-2]
MDRIIKPVFWTNRASKDLEKITRFNTKLKGKEKSREISENIRSSTEQLENPDYDYTAIGTIDDQFAYLKREYRKIFAEGCKITYREGNNKIFITRVFDQKQRPSKNK